MLGGHNSRIEHALIACNCRQWLLVGTHADGSSETEQTLAIELTEESDSGKTGRDHVWGGGVMAVPCRHAGRRQTRRHTVRTHARTDDGIRPCIPCMHARVPRLPGGGVMGAHERTDGASLSCRRRTADRGVAWCGKPTSVSRRTNASSAAERDARQRRHPQARARRARPWPCALIDSTYSQQLASGGPAGRPASTRRRPAPTSLIHTVHGRSPARRARARCPRARALWSHAWTSRRAPLPLAARCGLPRHARRRVVGCHNG